MNNKRNPILITTNLTVLPLPFKSRLPKNRVILWYYRYYPGFLEQPFGVKIDQVRKTKERRLKMKQTQETPKKNDSTKEAVLRAAFELSNIK
jgi:hypothetical protein